MATALEIPPFQLYLERSQASWHTLNEDGEVNRWNVTDESVDGFTILVTLEKAIHGEGENLNSFIGFHFSFRGVNDKRRFKSVRITIRFEDELRPLLDDPEVIKIWPDTEYIWQGMIKEIEETKSVEGQVSGGAYGAEASLSGKWQRQEKFERSTHARLSGEKRLLKRKSGSHKNAVFIRISENVQESLGVLRELRAGILVSRKYQGQRRFKVYINIDAEADMRYGVVKGLKKLIGTNHVTDPIIFEPGVNFFDDDDVASINGDVPSKAMVDKYGDVVSWTELVNVAKKVYKEEGEWKEKIESPSDVA
ncbi:hypothetical protein V8C35DRAFT_211 [Trichoderma chlorosporum]